jgi:hypothetical protein
MRKVLRFYEWNTGKPGIGQQWTRIPCGGSAGQQAGFGKAQCVVAE